jgi:hypothetical protein
MTASKSPQRHSFQREGYLKRCEDKNEEPDQNYLDMFQQILEDADKKWQTPESMKNNMEYDLVTTDWILAKARASKSYAQNLYAAICNNDFTKREMWPILKEEKWSASWRSAGGIVADMRQEGDYIDWYCSGIGGQNAEYNSEETNDQWQARTGYVPESVVTQEIEDDLYKLGWLVIRGE